MLKKYVVKVVKRYINGYFGKRSIEEFSWILDGRKKFTVLLDF